MNSKFKKDYDYGINKEDEIKDILERYFNMKLKKSKQFKSYDYKGKGVRIEIKSRRINSTLYSTSLLCKSKLNYYNKIKKKKDYYIVFNFLDDIKIIKFNDELLNLPLKKIKISRGDIVENIEIKNDMLISIRQCLLLLDN
jgi:hypothetical protein